MKHEGQLALAELILSSEIFTNFEIVRVEQVPYILSRQNSRRIQI